MADEEMEWNVIEYKVNKRSQSGRKIGDLLKKNDEIKLHPSYQILTVLLASEHI